MCVFSAALLFPPCCPSIHQLCISQQTPLHSPTELTVCTQCPSSQPQCGVTSFVNLSQHSRDFLHRPGTYRSTVSVLCLLLTSFYYIYIMCMIVLTHSSCTLILIKTPLVTLSFYSIYLTYYWKTESSFSLSLKKNYCD